MKLSVLICIYGGDNADYFIDAYSSILDQSLIPNEIVLVVDGPVNAEISNNIEIFKTRSSFLGIKFCEVQLQKNLGHGEARRRGVLACGNELIAVVDSDDINYRERFDMQVKFLNENPDISVVGAQIVEIEHDVKIPTGKKMVPEYHEMIVKYLTIRCPFNQMSVMFRKCDVVKAGNYISFYHNEDYYLWIRMHLLGLRFHNLPDFLVNARVDNTFYMRRGGYKYFLSEYRIQKFMFDNKIIALPKFIFNVGARLVLQVVLPGSVRGRLFKLFFRKRV